MDKPRAAQKAELRVAVTEYSLDVQMAAERVALLVDKTAGEKVSKTAATKASQMAVHLAA